MNKDWIQHLSIALALGVVVGIVAGGRWPHVVLGAGLAVTLWLILFAGSFAGPRPERGRVEPRQYLVAAVVALVLGVVMRLVTGEELFWPVGVVFAGLFAPAARRVAAR